ncbi:MAG TPA: protein kinase [Bryobacteraceae bacterium]|jgi:serine/threonine protein kinase|nr:protein kinase [Bryobacteraceae bacterium]
MSLAPGDRLGPYEITALLGQGGMGEVWRARDPRLNRDVAVKVSAQQFSDRFEREARAIAALNHPNICTLFDVGPNYLVMELVDGATLSERIAQGPVPLDEALGIAKQIADALEAAHEKSIVHRDLKPANIKIKPDGSVKVLDFGLAKAGEAMEMSTDSPTMMPVQGTQFGMILGTAGYMAPEQARGQTVDKRADIWAFGIVVYEMVTGKRLFDAPTATDSLAAILTKAPDLTIAPVKTRRLLARCLEKDSRKRLRDIGDWADLLDADRLNVPASPSRFGFGGWIAAGIFALAAITLAFVHFRQTPSSTGQTLRATIPTPESAGPGFLALSPDGKNLVVGNTGPLFIRALDSPQVKPIAGTTAGRSPFWSPDSKTIAYFEAGKLKTIPAAGGPPQPLCDLNGFGGGGTWNSDGVILFGDSSGAFKQVKASGGECTPLTKSAPGFIGTYPAFLADGKHFLYMLIDDDDAKRGVWLNSLSPESGADRRGRRLLADYSGVVYSPPQPGSRYSHLLFLRDTTLFAQPFDDRSLQLAGDPFPVAEHVSQGSDGQLDAAIDLNGNLVFATNVDRESQLALLDRSGKVISKVGPSQGQTAVALSPDGTTVATTKGQSGRTGIWLRNLLRDSESRLADRGFGSVWSPDEKNIVYSGRDDAHANVLFVKDASGGGRDVALVKSANALRASDWSRDGRFLLYTEIDPKTNADIWYIPDPLRPTPGKPVLFLGTKGAESQAQFSPDGHWVAYWSNESGKSEIYIRPFPSGAGQTRVASDLVREPRWSPDGKEIYYWISLVGAAHRMLAASVKPGRDGMPEVGVPQTLFDFRTAPPAVATVNAYLYSPAPGGRFLMNLDAESAPPTINLITNWQKLAPPSK